MSAAQEKAYMIYQKQQQKTAYLLNLLAALLIYDFNQQYTSTFMNFVKTAQRTQ